MGKIQFCRICRTEDNLKYTAKELRQLNKKRLLLAQANSAASKKLLLTTPTLGNICHICDKRIQIFHRLDEGANDSSSDVEIEVVSNTDGSLSKRSDSVPNRDFLPTMQRPETPVIVDDDDMLFNIFMKKFEQKTQLSQQQVISTFSRQLETQFTNKLHSTYTPPQSTGGSSEGDESKVIEILTSRENTPIPRQCSPTITSNCDTVDKEGHRIVAIIELDDGDDNEQEHVKVAKIEKKLSYSDSGKHKPVLSPTSNNFKFSIGNETCLQSVVKDEEIAFCKVDNEKEEVTVLKKRNRKSYDEKELRLVATLNLVSSDSETDESSSKIKKLVVNKDFTCNTCQIKLPDLESLSVHERIHQGIKCILCTVCFQQVKPLIHHMRRKHREYNGDTLSEKPRSGQDSCMTIRLRYMQHTTFYECQLCGRIDEVFKEHKEHIIDKHPNESKSLKDPIMKQLKCPVCKAKCGSKYLTLCCHLISSHDYQEYKSHLRELVHFSAFGWNASRQEEVAKTAKIFQFVKRKTLFFECRTCCKVVAGYLHHLRHISEHQKSININTKLNEIAIKDILPIKASIKKSNLQTLCKSLKTDELCISNNLKKKYTLRNVENHKNSKNKTKISNQIEEKNLNDVQKSKCEKPMTTIQSKKPESKMKSEPDKKIILKGKCKSKDKEVVKLSSDCNLTKGKSKKETIKAHTKKFTQLKPQFKKILLKTAIRQIDLQKYKCIYCLKKFKGFRFYNLHLLRQHKDNEYITCNKCNKIYKSSYNFDEHIKECPQVFPKFKRKRKFTESSLQCVKKVPNKNDDDFSSVYLNDDNIWLKELPKLRKTMQINDSKLNYNNKSPETALFYTQNCYCFHPFANNKVLEEHEQHHHCLNPDILIRYKPLKRIYVNE